MSNITLELKARHFYQTNYSDNCDCAISKAAKELFMTDWVNEGVDSISIGEDDYSHEPYLAPVFDADCEQAASLNYSDAVIRTITLVKQ